MIVDDGLEGSDREDDGDDKNTAAVGEAISDGATIENFLREFPGGGHQFAIKRIEPKSILVGGQTKKLNGHIETLHHPPTLDEIKESWGGGVYDIRVMGPRPGSKGPRYLTSRRIEIAGDPKWRDEISVAASAPAAAATSAPALVEKVLDATIDDKRRAEDRFERAVSSGNPDAALLRTTLETIERSQTAQLETLRQQLERRDRELAELRQNRSPFEHPEVLKALLGRGADDSTRMAEGHRRDLEAERERREREQRDFGAERERHERELRAERERHQRDLELERRDRDNAVQTIERLHKSEIENLKTAHAQLVASKDEHITRLQEEMRTARQNEKPHDTLSDLQRMSQVVDAVKNIVPGLGAGDSGDDEEPASIWHALLQKAPALLETFGDAQAKKAAAEEAMRTAVLHRLAARQALVPRIVSPVPMAPIRPMPAAAIPAATTAPTKPAVAPPPPSPMGLSDGLAYLTQAFANHQPAAEVARAAVALFGRAAVAPLVQADVDGIVKQVETLDRDSILASPGGRRYLRELVGALREQLKS